MFRVLPLLITLAAACAGAEQAEEPRVGVARPVSEAEPSAATPTAPEVAETAEEPAEAEPQTEPAQPEPPEVDPVAALMALDGSRSTSIGGPNNGRLEGGVPLPDSAPGMRSNPERPNDGAHYGTVEMVQALVRAAGIVHEAFDGEAEVTINDLGFEEGGPIPHHSSHQAGRDADVLFYYLDREGEPIRSKGVPVDLEGRGWDFGDLADPEDDVFMRLDVPRTWKYVEAILMDESVSVNRLYLAEHIRTMLLEEAERVNAPARAVRLFRHVTCQPGAPHDDHLHFRFFCTAEDIAAGCQDAPPFYYWHRNALEEQGAEIAREVRSRDHDRAVRQRVVSRDEARARAERRT